MPYAPLMEYSEPIVRGVYDIAHAHLEILQIVVKVGCRHPGRTSEDQYGNRSHTLPATTQGEPIVIDAESLNEIRKYRDVDHYTTTETIASFAEKLGDRLEWNSRIHVTPNTVARAQE